MAIKLPTGPAVTFMFTDIEGSAALMADGAATPIPQIVTEVFAIAAPDQAVSVAAGSPDGGPRLPTV